MSVESSDVPAQLLIAGRQLVVRLERYVEAQIGEMALGSPT